MTGAPSWSSHHESEFVSVEVDSARGLVRVARHERRFEDALEIRQGLREVLEALERLEGSPRGLLLDFRKGPSSNSRTFEEHFVPFLVDATRRYERAAGLVRSAVGKLQLQRYIRQGRLENLQAFINERLAVAFLE